MHGDTFAPATRSDESGLELPGQIIRLGPQRQARGNCGAGQRPAREFSSGFHCGIPFLNLIVERKVRRGAEGAVRIERTRREWKRRETGTRGGDERGLAKGVLRAGRRGRQFQEGREAGSRADGSPRSRPARLANAVKRRPDHAVSICGSSRTSFDDSSSCRTIRCRWRAA